MYIHAQIGQKGRWVLAAAFSVALSACATETQPMIEEAPEVALDSLEGQDQGTSYGGWTQSTEAFACTDIPYWWYAHSLARTSGPSTRGGGACVVKGPGISCTTDSQCLASAQAAYGSSAWGYCYSNKCYSRPGSQAAYCRLNPNRSPGGLGQYEEWALPGGIWNAFTVNCMTKAAGPSYDCGGSDPTKYMRSLTAFNTGTCF